LFNDPTADPELLLLVIEPPVVAHVAVNERETLGDGFAGGRIKDPATGTKKIMNLLGFDVIKSVDELEYVELGKKSLRGAKNGAHETGAEGIGGPFGTPLVGCTDEIGITEGVVQATHGLGEASTALAVIKLHSCARVAIYI